MDDDGEKYAIVRGSLMGRDYALIEARTGLVVLRSDSVAALVKYALDHFDAYVTPPL